MSGRQYCQIVTDMALGRADVTNAAVPMFDVVPMNKAGRPGASVVEFSKAFGRKLGPVFGGAKQRLRVSVVITDSGS